MTKRDHTAIKAPIDIYVAGIPCQPFSRSGVHGGIDDSRGQLFFHVAAFLTSNRPEPFVIENVSSLVTDHAETFECMLTILRNITGEDKQTGFYSVAWKILHTSEHGLPQHRERVFIVGTKKAAMQFPFAWPHPTKMRSLTSILGLPQDPAAEAPQLNNTNLKNLLAITDSYKDKGNRLIEVENICNIGGASPHIMENMCPCLTKTRCSSQGYYSFSQTRSLSVYDMCRLQGVPAKDIAGWSNIVSKSQIGGIIGNAIPICLMERLLREVLISTGWAVHADRWADAKAVSLE